MVKIKLSILKDEENRKRIKYKTINRRKLNSESKLILIAMAS